MTTILRPLHFVVQGNGCFWQIRCGPCSRWGGGEHAMNRRVSPLTHFSYLSQILFEHSPASHQTEMEGVRAIR